MTDLIPGGNLPLPDGALTLRVPGPFDLSVLITGDSGKVAGDADFVFYNQPAAPGARLSGDTVTVDTRRLRTGASRVTVAVSPAEPGTPLGRLPSIALQVSGLRGETVARFRPPRPDHETVLLLAEIYRRGTAWKIRALGQGYADGLAGVARDFGLDVTDDAPPPAPPQPTPSPRVPARPAPGIPASSGNVPAPSGPGSRTASGTPAPPRPRTPTAPPPPAPQAPPPTTWPAPPPAAHAPPPPTTDTFLTLVNAARAQTGAPPVRLDPRLTEAARAHAAGMAARGRLGSEGPDGVSLHQRVAAGGYAYLAMGEHLVSGPRSPADFLDYCLGDDHSRQTVLERAYSHVGVAHVPAARSGDVFWTALWAEPFSPQGLARTTADVLTLTNSHRTAAGLRPLAPDLRLTTAAQAHSADMVARAFYSHTAPDGSEPWHRAAAAGSPHRTVGENIACGQRSAAEVVQGWMDSPGHRANILKPAFTHLGVGYAGGGSAGTYWTQLFGG
ncbi:CAP domain-containing protein [Streptomyces aureoverticillatus]|uniref:CAP domain-containing protein n=1 Tax=Streptomyces aureoverticillatus TaxID=66871 RepID=UPI0013DBE949|nr:CAP domain-containing protein [Streptomyces aureoverticillatus]QIB42372.1 stress protein [Streptomyces aureoverticillatus]